MRERIITALILVTIVGVALFATTNPMPMLALLGVGLFIAAREWTNFIPKLTYPSGFIFLSLAATTITLFYQSFWTLTWCMSAILWGFAAVWVKRYPQQQTWYTKGLYPIGIVALTATITAMFYLWQQSPWWLLYVFVLVWCADSGAYFAGRAFGKHKLAPNVSPKKTYEGMIGGILAGCVVVIAIGTLQLALTNKQLLLFLGLSVFTIAISVLGDLFESMLKRRAGIKDSGTLLPGHGGVLDRIDSLLAAVPIFALGYWVSNGFIT